MTGVIYVTYVLCIERFNTCGRFTSARWKELFILFKKRVSTINIYSFNIKEMEDTFIGNRYNIIFKTVNKKENVIISHEYPARQFLRGHWSHVVAPQSLQTWLGNGSR